MYCVLYRDKDTKELRPQDCYNTEYADCLRSMGYEVLDVKPITWEQHILYNWQEMLFYIFGVTANHIKQPIQQEFNFD